MKWVSPTAEPVVRAAIARVRKLTEGARRRAKILEADASRVPLPPEFDGRESVTSAELNILLGQKCSSASAKISHTLCRKKAYYRQADIESYLLGRRVADLHTIKRDGQGVQSLSESLFIIFAGQSYSAWHSPCALLVEPVTPNTLRAFMSAPRNGNNTTLFATFGTTEEQKTFSAKPTSFRHWLNHIAYKGKMPVHLIARYFARESPRHTRDYLHYSPEKVGEYVREEMRAGRVFGPVAKTYWSLPPDRREEYLLGQITVGHFTPWGLCVRNLALHPCDKHLNCLNDCRSFCSTKGDAAEIAALLDLEAKTEALLEKSEEAERAGQRWAEAYVSYHSKTLARIRATLAKHRDLSVKDGTVVHPFAGGSVEQSSL